MRSKPRGAVVYGIDIGKSLFHVAGTDQVGNVLQQIKMGRETLIEFFSNASPALVGMEACPGSQWLARKLQALGHTVRIMPAQFVKPYVKSNKSDAIDARAIAEAVTRPDMRFAQIKGQAQLEVQALHRVRERLMSSRTALINQMRAFLLESGVPVHKGAGRFKADFPKLIADESNELTPSTRNLLLELREELRSVETRLEGLTDRIEAQAAEDDLTRRLATVPGIGKLTASALAAAAGDAKQFAKARDMAAWLGLVPAQHSTGGKTTLLGISKRGNAYVRKLLVHGARTCVIHLDRSRDRLGRWLTSLESRMHRNKVVVALANKIARIAWVVMTRQGALYEKRMPQRG